MKNIEQILFAIVAAGVVVILAADELRQVLWYVAILAFLAVIYRILFGHR
jgi:hypothetical protein